MNHVICYRCEPPWVAPAEKHGPGPIWELPAHQVDAHGEIRKARVLNLVPSGVGVQRRREHVA